MFSTTINIKSDHFEIKFSSLFKKKNHFQDELEGLEKKRKVRFPSFTSDRLKRRRTQGSRSREIEQIELELTVPARTDQGAVDPGTLPSPHRTAPGSEPAREASRMRGQSQEIQIVDAEMVDLSGSMVGGRKGSQSYESAKDGGIKSLRSDKSSKVGEGKGSVCSGIAKDGAVMGSRSSGSRSKDEPSADDSDVIVIVEDDSEQEKSAALVAKPNTRGKQGKF